MNIHINEEEFNQLNEHTLVQIMVGSHSYRLNNESSDKDVLNITYNLTDNLHSLIQLHHQYQYKSNNTDYLFCSLQTFVKNLLSGDSTINFEAIFSDEIKNHKDLCFLYDFRKNFYNYNLIRSYLGLCRRDLKAFKKEENNKKLFHALRGLFVANLLFNNEEYNNDLKSLDTNTGILLTKIKNNFITKAEANLLSKDLAEKVDELRLQLNQRLNEKKIHKVMDIQKLKELDSWFIKISKQNVKQGFFSNDQYYAAIQDEIKYDN